jgi:hypothetical protein
MLLAVAFAALLWYRREDRKAAEREHPAPGE